ncbi:ATP-binding protein [Chondromyces apiculatus]|uniref:ATP-binding protein n=1 Tax=Chondromyces apiculatus TaxID=51 RepID=UPI0018CC7A62|nr:ATP-binding protein [Chondromyces apiculatus]
MRSVNLPPAIVGRFRSLSLERLDRIETEWAAVLAGDHERAAEVHNELHTLKGDARVVGFSDVHLLAHKLEELLVAAEHRNFRVPEEFDLVMTMAIRLVVMLLRTRDGVSLGGIDVDGFVQQIDELVADSQVRSVESTEQPPMSRRVPINVEPLDRVAPATQQGLAAAATDVYLESLRAGGAARERLQAVWRALSHQIADLYAAPLAPRVTRHQHAALRLARDLGKETAVEVITGDVRVRADAADALETALLHLLRNAVDHGIEFPDERVRLGKPPTGRIRVQVRMIDGGGEVEVDDDGHGIDLEEVRRKAVERGFMTPQDAETASERELTDVVLQPGFSTRSQVTDVSGRGIGLDAVRSTLARVGGHIAVTTHLGHGTTVTARVPQASRRLRVLCFPAWGADLTFAVPATFDAVPRNEDSADALDPLDLLQLETGSRRGNRLCIELNGEDFSAQLRAGGPPFRRTAERFCPTPDRHPVEVVRLGDDEALLLRPEALLPMRRRA